MPESIEQLDQRAEELRAQVRQALLRGDREGARALRGELRRAERAWHDAIELDEPGPRAGNQAPRGPLLPLREQVHQALTLLTVPAGPRLISSVHEALFVGAIPAARLTSVRRDEERSFRTAPFARPYYLCAALTADLLAPARGLLAVSTWPMERRVIGPLSPRADYLTAAVQIAKNVQRIPMPSTDAMRLLWRFAVNIPGATVEAAQVDPAAVARAAQSELEVHANADTKTRRSAAIRARRQLDEAQQLFGSRLGTVLSAEA
ncbi:MAG TPA: hypothetical protein VNF47_03350 [Streptosporangiaceae bacterium]|nr:hypothetical protein [Streptosporangiaceae bacterium]